MDPDPESRASAPLGPVYVLPPDQRPWLPARGVPRALRQAYYAALNTDHRFADDLRALFQALDRHAAEAGGPADERWWQAVWGLALDPETVESPFTAVLPQARAAVVAFCERWPLPERVHEDLYATDRQRRANPPHGCDQPLGTGLVSGELGAHAGLLLPPRDPLPAIVYDPQLTSRSLLNDLLTAVCDAVLQHYRAQAEALERALRAQGIAPPPPHFRSPARVRQHGRRLYRRAVLRLTWEALAELERQVRDEGAPAPPPGAQVPRLLLEDPWAQEPADLAMLLPAGAVPDATAVRKTTTDAAARIGLPLH